MGDREIAEEVAGKLLGREKCKDCGKYFPRKEMMTFTWPLATDYVCKECDKQYECTID